MNVVVVSPHPDDETLGAGGTLLRLKKEDHKVYWINVTNVTNSSKWSKEFVEIRKRQISEVIKKYEFNGYYDLGFEPCSLEDMDKGNLIDAVSKCFQEIKPEWIIIPNPEDAHTDHKVVYEACMSCSKVFRYPYVKKITVMEVLSETDFSKDGGSFSPNYYVDVTDTLEAKLEAMQLYNTELGEWPFPRSLENIKALAMVRGGTAGVKYAEAFRIIKWIE